MLLNQIFVTPSPIEGEFKPLTGLYTKGKIYPVYAVADGEEKLLVANDEGRLHWEYFGRFRITQVLTRVIDQNAISDELLQAAITNVKEELGKQKEENPLLAKEEPIETEVKPTKKGAKNG